MAGFDQQLVPAAVVHGFDLLGLGDQDPDRGLSDGGAAQGRLRRAIAPGVVAGVRRDVAPGRELGRGAVRAARGRRTDELGPHLEPPVARRQRLVECPQLAEQPGPLAGQALAVANEVVLLGRGGAQQAAGGLGEGHAHRKVWFYRPARVSNVERMLISTSP